MAKKKKKYATVRIPIEMVDEVDRFIGKLGFRSRAEIVKEAIRNQIYRIQEFLVAREQTKTKLP